MKPVRALMLSFFIDVLEGGNIGGGGVHSENARHDQTLPSFVIF